MKNSKVLVFNSIWPSSTHPYITYLYDGLKNNYPNLEIFLFKKNPIAFAAELLGQEKSDRLNESLILRFNFTKNPLAYFEPLISIFKSPLKSFRIFRICLKEGYKIHQSIGQLVYFHRLISKEYNLVYFNSLQIARHICIEAFFPESIIICSSRGQDFDFEPDSFDKVLKSSNHLHVLGEYLKIKASQRGFDDSKITVIHPATLPFENGVSTKNEEIKCLKLITASRLFWSKGHIYVLRALAGFKQKHPNINFSYTVVGDGPEKDFLLFETNRLGLNNTVNFLGWKNQNEVNTLILESDIYILLSIEEGFNNSVTQAQNFSKPCIVSNTGGLPENVRHKYSGLVIDSYEPNELLSSLEYLIEDNRLTEFGKNAFNHVRNRSLEDQIEKFSKMFNSVISN